MVNKEILTEEKKLAHKRVASLKWRNNRNEKQKLKDIETSKKSRTRRSKEQILKDRESCRNSAKKFRENMTEEQKIRNRESAKRSREKRKDKIREYHLKNRERINLRSKEWKTKNKEKIFFGGIKSRYGLTEDQYKELVKHQNNCCAICGIDSPTKKGWCVDHCHKTNKVRGILCSNCNSLLGFAKENIKTLEFSILYIKKYS